LKIPKRRTLIVAATLQEIEPSLDGFRSGGIDVLVTGVGMPSTVYALAKKLRQERYGLIVNVGVGGILDRSEPLGEVYRVVQDEVFRFGAEDGESFIAIEELGFGRSVFAERPPNNLSDRMKASLSAIKTVRGITVNTVHGSAESIRRLRQNRPNGNLMESMEGAGFFFVADAEQIPALQFRAASNYIEPRNRSAWELATAIGKLNGFLRDFLFGDDGFKNATFVP